MSCKITLFYLESNILLSNFPIFLSDNYRVIIFQAKYIRADHFSMGGEPGISTGVCIFGRVLN